MNTTATHDLSFWQLAAHRAPDENMMYYVNASIVACVFYLLVHYLIHVIAMRKYSVYKDEMDTRARVEYRSYICSPIHALLSVGLSMIAMFWICGHGKTVFNDDQCINTPRYIHIWALLNTCGYFITDFFWLACVVRGTSALDYQMYAHHIIGAFTFYQTLFFMDFMVVFGVMLLFQEVSTTYVSMRWLLHKHKLSNTNTYNINQLVTFVTFLVFRLIYQIYITFFLAMDWIVKEIE